MNRACWILPFLVLLLAPAIGLPETRMTASPFLEYAYLTDIGGAVPVLDQIDAMVGGWLGDYRKFKLFNHLFLVGTEIRIGFPDRWPGLDFLVSIAGSAGSVGMLGKDYDETDDITSLPDIPGLSIPDILTSLSTIDGRVRTRIDQTLNYAVPMQFGVRYELDRIGERPFFIFGSACAGPVFIKGGLDLAGTMNGTARFAVLSETFDGNIDGKVVFKDAGWTASLTAGVRYEWNSRISSSIAVGYGLGEVRDNATFRGRFTGGSPNLGDVDIHVNFREPVILKLDSYRFRCEFLTWKW